MFKTEGREETLWNLATDIHVEYVLDSMDIELLYCPAYPFRESYFQKLEKEVKSLSAERIYAYLSEQNLSYSEKERLEQEFVKDDHCFWKKLGEEEGKSGTEEMESSEAGESRESTENPGGRENRKETESSERRGDEEREESFGGEKDGEKNDGLESPNNENPKSQREGDSQSERVKDEEGIEKEENAAQGSGDSKITEEEKQRKKSERKPGNENRTKEEERRKELDRDWEDIGKRTEEEMKGERNKEKGEILSWFLRLEHKSYTPFREFLRKFSVDREELKTDPESFDYGYYCFGLSQYGNMPLIEENEYREKRKIPELVIAIDTSYSTKGEMVKHFLEETLAILEDKDAFFSKCRVHILECDDRIREDILIENAEEMERYRESFEVNGGYGTDFRPVFHYIEDLRKKGELKELKALLYFTDGRGRYPKYAPNYTAAFVFPKGEDIDDENAPFWVMKLYI